MPNACADTFTGVSKYNATRRFPFGDSWSIINMIACIRFYAIRAKKFSITGKFAIDRFAAFRRTFLSTPSSPTTRRTFLLRTTDSGPKGFWPKPTDRAPSFNAKALFKRGTAEDTSAESKST